MTYMPRNLETLGLADLKEVIEQVTLSRQQVWRMTAAGRFPKSVSLSCKRVGWRRGEVLAWMQARIDERPGAPCVQLHLDDRFLNVKEVCRRTSLSNTQLCRLADQGDFPPVARISDGRIAWLEREVNSWLVSLA